MKDKNIKEDGPVFFETRPKFKPKPQPELQPKKYVYRCVLPENIEYHKALGYSKDCSNEEIVKYMPSTLDSSLYILMKKEVIKS